MGESESGIVRRVLASIRPGEIVLMHVGSRSSDPRALRAVIAAIRARRYGFATLAGLR
jgi:peptidoglycan/xylan/chitin deacetylase (PgdA/CDA1 family)